MECNTYQQISLFKFDIRNDDSKRDKVQHFYMEITQYHPALPNVKNILMGKWHLIQNQPYLKEVFQGPPILSYHKGKLLKDTLVRAKL